MLWTPYVYLAIPLAMGRAARAKSQNGYKKSEASELLAATLVMTMPHVAWARECPTRSWAAIVAIIDCHLLGVSFKRAWSARHAFFEEFSREVIHTT